MNRKPLFHFYLYNGRVFCLNGFARTNCGFLYHLLSFRGDGTNVGSFVLSVCRLWEGFIYIHYVVNFIELNVALNFLYVGVR